MEPCPDAIERNAVNTSGRLGSVYDVSRDLLRANGLIETSDDPQYNQISTCSVLPGAESNGVLNLLKAIKFDDALLHSILFGIVQPSGISSFINYNQPITENTRFLYYSYRHRGDKLHVIAGQADKVISLPTELDYATHMITEIVWGFEILCVIQNPTQQSANAIEQVLYSISDQLQNCDKALQLTREEKRQINELSNVTVFGSEKCVDNSNPLLLTVLDRIRGWQRHTSFHDPIIYTLRPLKWLYKNQQFPELCHLSEKDNSHIAQIEPDIIYLSNCIQDMHHIFKKLPKHVTSLELDRRLEGISEKFGVLSSTYEEFQTEHRKMLVRVRRGSSQSREVNSVISNKRYLVLRKPAVDVFYTEVQELLAKVKLIERLKNGKITYTNIFDIVENQSIYLTFQDIDEVLKNYFSKKHSSAILWYSSDRLKREKKDEWKQVLQQLILEQQQQTTQQTLLFYVDFAQCPQQLEDTAIRRLPIQSSLESQNNHPTERLSPSVPPEQPTSGPSLSSQRSPPPKTEINVLLFGETGVGKSTFINAFVNYLIFDTLQQAEQNEPVVLIPVSFLTTVGDQFDEFIVKFGNVDANEDFEHQGQSVTQQCKSYVFHLNDRLLLRLIDTPGMGDTRGVDQDDKNIYHILTYVNSLSHLNAVCLLLKPNASRLNVVFRSCINQLFTYLTPVSYSNIIFCFTNSRATFYAPGDTGPLLRQMLEKEHQDDIPFAKTNTFCFDSESFRYLAARKCGVTFDDFQTRECINSWTTSVTESVRLLNYILTREPYNLNEWQSPRKAALEISMLARPLMETLRLIIYNWHLCEIDTIDNQMILNSHSVDTEMCSNCVSSRIVRVGPFFFTQYQRIPSKTNVTERHQCSSNSKHFLIEFIVKYDFIAESQNRTKEKLQDFFHDLLFKCDKLTHFLRQQRLSAQEDPFTPILERFLEEECRILDYAPNDSNMNRRVVEVLSSVEEIRLKNSIQLHASNKRLTLDEICQIIDALKSLQAIKKQIDSTTESRRLKMKAYEYQVETNIVRNKTFTKLTNSFQ